MRYYIQNKVIHLIFDVNQTIIEDVKAIAGSSYIPENREWIIPINLSNGGKVKQFLSKWNFKEDNKAIFDEKDDVIFSDEDIKEREAGIKTIKKLLPKLNLTITPREWQWEGIYYMTLWGNMINGADMGLGKSPMTIFTAELNNWFPCLVICPPSTVYQWAELWLKANPNRSVSVIETKAKKGIDWTADVMIVSWSSIASKDDEDNIVPKFKELFNKWTYLVADEIHYAKKGAKSMRGDIFMKIARRSEFVAGLSGTLATNRPAEIIKPLTAIKQFKPLFKDWNTFVHRYCNAFKDEYGRLNYSGANNVIELNKILRRNCYFRINKSDIKGKTAVEKTYDWIELSNQKEYLKAEKEFIQYLIKHEQDKFVSAVYAEVLVKRSILRRLAIKGKMKAIYQWIDDFIESSNGKLVVSGIHTEPLKQIAEKYKCLLINGEVDSKNKREYVKSFQTNKDRVICAQSKAVGTGTDGLQQSSSTLLVIELPDTPAELEQLISRLDRDGQKEQVNVYFMLANDTVDVEQHEMVVEKGQIVDAINKGAKYFENKLLNS